MTPRRGNQRMNGLAVSLSRLKTIGVSKIIRPQQSYEVLPLCQIDDFSLYFISNKAEKVRPPVKYVLTPLQSN